MGCEDPYVVWKTTIYAWMMCCKRTRMFNGRLTRDIALMIAQYVLPDFSGEIDWTDRFRQTMLLRLPVKTKRFTDDGDFVSCTTHHWTWVSKSFPSPNFSISKSSPSPSYKGACQNCLRPKIFDGLCVKKHETRLWYVRDEDIDLLHGKIIPPDRRLLR